MKKLLRNKIILAGAGVAVLALIFVFVLRPMLFGGGGSTAGEGGEQVAHAESTETPPGPTYRLKDRILNLNGAPRHYLKLGIALEFKPEKDAYYKLSGEAKTKADEEFSASLASRVPAIEDAVTTLVSARTYEQVGTPSGQAALKDDLMSRIRDLVHEPELVRIYFTEFVTQ